MKKLSVDNVIEALDRNSDREELLNILKKLISIRSDYPHACEEKIAKYIEQLLFENGIESKLYWAEEGRPNLIAEIDGQYPGPDILFNGHMDVVPANEDWDTDPFRPTIENGKVYGRGAADMKSGVAAMIYTAIKLKRGECPFRGKLILYFNVDEERKNVGMHSFLKTEITADYAIIGEPTEMNLCIAHKGVARYKLKTFGKTQHASKTGNKLNAIVNMSKIIDGLENYNSKLGEKIDYLLGSPSLTVTKIDGGSAINVVPGECEIEIDRRLIYAEEEKKVYCELEKVIKDIAEPYNIKYSIDNYLFLPATKIDPNHDLINAMRNTYEEINENNMEVKIFDATCEAPFLSIYKKIPTVILGPGSLKQAHVVNEFVEMEQLEKAYDIYLNFMLNNELAKGGNK